MLSTAALTEPAAVCATLARLKSLTRLDLLNGSPSEEGDPKKGLKQVPEQLFAAAGLEELELGGNPIASLPAGIARLKQLRKLVMPRRKLKTLPKEASALALLEELDVRQNTIASRPAELGKLAKLKTLNVGNNELKEIPGGAQQARQAQGSGPARERTEEAAQEPRRLDRARKLEHLSL